MVFRLLTVFCLTLVTLPAGAAAVEVQVSPRSVVLDRPEATQQLLVWKAGPQGRNDITRSAKFQVLPPERATVTPSGRVVPRTEGSAEIVVTTSLGTQRIPLRVNGLSQPQPISFRREVIPILSKAGCNSGGCHGKAEGQNGFKLSVFGFDPLHDHDALVKEGRGRRLFQASPERSLLLRKATAQTPHGGGHKVVPGSLWYRRLHRWIAEGAAIDGEEAATITGIEVEPAEIVMEPNGTQQLRVTARFSDGRQRCVTVEAEYSSNAEPIADSDRHGLVSVRDIPGEAAILVRYMGQVAICRVTLPQPRVTFTRPPESNFVDKAVWDKLQRLGIKPSGLASDQVFLRRVYLDTIGTLPTVDEANRFLQDKSADKRSRVIDRLLQRDEYADYWAMRWADVLRVDKSIVSPQGAVAMTRWLRRQFKENTPYDQFVREIVTARGSTLAESPAAFFHVQKDPQMAGRAVSQVFLGVRIECAQCHHHPFEKWSQRDYFAFGGFFTGVGRKKAGVGQKIFVQKGSLLKHPRTQQAVPVAGLGAPPAKLEEGVDRRRPLADWMTNHRNPFLARMIVNRLWAHYLGRGLVEPIDDMRATNPASNEPLLQSLAAHLIHVKYDLKALTRVILNSRVYQLDAGTNETNAADRQNYSHARWKPLPAEVLLDAICQATGVEEEFNGWPKGVRAIQVWDNRMPSYFFRVFGRPQRVSVCECERSNDPSIAQALHLMNSPESVRKLRHRTGRAAILARSTKTPDEITTELYLATLSRLPTDKEKALMRHAFEESTNRRAATEDILWVLLNTKEFVYSH